MLRAARKPRTGRKRSEREEKITASFIKKKKKVLLSFLPFL